MEKSKTITLRQSYEKIVGYSHKFYNTIWGFVGLLGATLIFGIVQAALFGTGNMEVNGYLFSDPGAWIAWFSLALTTGGTLLQFVGTVYLMRFHAMKNLIFTASGWVLFIINTAITGIWFTTATYTIIVGLTFIRYFMWTKQGNDNTDKTPGNTKFWLSFFVGVSLYALLGFLLYGLNVIPFNAGPGNDWLKYMDVLNGVFSIMAMFLLMAKSKWAFVCFFLSGIPSLIMFGIFGQIVSIVSIAVFRINDVVAWFAWSIRDMDNNDNKANRKAVKQTAK